jgi:hypothetical protein
MQNCDLLGPYAKPKFKHLRYISVDKVAIAKRLCYLTVVMNLESSVVVFVGDGKGADAPKCHFGSGYGPVALRLRPLLWMCVSGILESSHDALAQVRLRPLRCYQLV